MFIARLLLLLGLNISYLLKLSAVTKLLAHQQASSLPHKGTLSTVTLQFGSNFAAWQQTLF
jgi:hypothetical protein